jgi:hypothetical protein
MSEQDPLRDRGRALEEEYFRRKDQELIAKIRARAAAQATERDLGDSTGIDDPEILHELRALGFTPGTVALLPLMPVLQVAWAEGGVTPIERDLIEQLATARGIEPGTEADGQLMDWLANRPGDDIFEGATRLIRAMLDAGSPVMNEWTAADLVQYCEQVAAASGGVFGRGRVSPDEKAILESIATGLRARSQPRR